MLRHLSSFSTSSIDRSTPRPSPFQQFIFLFWVELQPMLFWYRESSRPHHTRWFREEQFVLIWRWNCDRGAESYLDETTRWIASGSDKLKRDDGTDAIQRRSSLPMCFFPSFETTAWTRRPRSGTKRTKFIRIGTHSVASSWYVRPTSDNNWIFPMAKR